MRKKMSMTFNYYRLISRTGLYGQDGVRKILCKLLCTNNMFEKLYVIVACRRIVSNPFIVGYNLNKKNCK